MLMYKIAIIGPESTGKTELAKSLAQSAHSLWVPEYAREYVEQLTEKYTFNDVCIIARKQIELEKQFENSNHDSEFVFFDTDLIITKVWFEYCYQQVPQFVIDHLKASTIDFYLICAPDLPWLPDPVREHGSDREYFFEWYKNEVIKTGKPFFVVNGTGIQRVNNATKAIKQFINSNQFKIKHNIMNNKVMDTIDRLADVESLKNICHHQNHNNPNPSVDVLNEIVQLTRAILFPGYFGDADVSSRSMLYHIGVNVDRLLVLLKSQIKAGLCFESRTEATTCSQIDEVAEEKSMAFIEQLPQIREKLHTDVIAAYNGDPAAKSFGEVIFCYPSIRAICNYRIANALLKLEVPLIPRIITEMAHSETGIDIHPGATIGNYFTIDHGTGVVIGETAIIGDNVKMYQGVTLGAKSFPLDENGNPIKGIQRHPHIGNNVIIYSNSTILGTITVGDGAVIGGNIWVDADVPAGAKIVQRK